MVRLLGGVSKARLEFIQNYFDLANPFRLDAI